MPAQSADEAVAAHYGRQGGDLGDAILAALRACGKDADAIDPDDLAPVDQFHLGGKGATRELMQRAGLAREMRVLDVGGGLGGPARTLASEAGCRVTVLDLTAEYCQAGALLTERTGLADRVTFRHGSALDLPFADGSFDAVWTQHSSMNVAAKERLYAEIYRVLRVGGRLALHEVMAGAAGDPVRFPVPWASDPAISFLVTADEARALLARAGFTELVWDDVSSEAVSWWRSQAAAMATAAPSPLGIHLLLGADAGHMTRNLMRNLEEGRIAVVRGVLEKKESE